MAHGKKLQLAVVILLLFISNLSAFGQSNISCSASDKLIFSGSEVELTFEHENSDFSGEKSVDINGKAHQVSFSGGKGAVNFQPDVEELNVSVDGNTQTLRVRQISGWWSIIPPLIAIFFALIFREVVPALVLGVFSGTLIYAGLGLTNTVEAFKSLIDTHVLNALSDSGHVSIIIFSMIIGGMVAVISKNGGMAGIVASLSAYAKSARSAQIVTWFLGILIFFDDYANTLVVGNTMRPVTDKFKISREKLAYLVDSTAAPVAAIAFITTWIGAELGYIDSAIQNLGITEGAYSIFLNSLRFAFYPIFTLAFMLMLIWTQKDFGPMWKAEDTARNNSEEIENAEGLDKELEEIQPKDGIKHKWYNAIIPIFTVILLTIVGLLYTGSNSSYDQIIEKGVEIQSGFFNTWAQLDHLGEDGSTSFIQKLGIVIGNSDSYQALLWSSLAGLLVAILLSVSQKLLSVKESFDATLNGFKAMLPAFVILTLAWALASVTEELHTASFLTSIFSDNISPIWMAGITFLLAAVVSFSTGSSWGTMAILYPLIIPAVYNVCQKHGLDMNETMEIIYNVVSVVLAGSVLGDHCSPISDTTILSSMATQCNHVKHVRTQLPYAAIVGAVSLFICIVLVNIGVPWYLNYLIGFGMLYGIVRFLGKKVTS